MDQEKVKQNLLQELELEDLPEDKQTELLQTMTKSLLKRITLRVLEELSDEDREEYEKIKEEGDSDKMEEFLRGKIDNYDEFVQSIVDEFKEEIKGYMEELKKEMEEKEE